MCGFETTETRTVRNNATFNTPTFIQSEVEMGVTPGMKAAAIVLSVFSPAFFIVYYIADSVYYKKTGKPLTFLTGH